MDITHSAQSHGEIGHVHTEHPRHVRLLGRYVDRGPDHIPFTNVAGSLVKRYTGWALECEHDDRAYFPLPIPRERFRDHNAFCFGWAVYADTLSEIDRHLENRQQARDKAREDQAEYDRIKAARIAALPPATPHWRTSID